MNENKINSSSNFMQSLQRLAQTKGVSEEKIQTLICQSFSQYYEQKLNQPIDFHFEFGEKLLIYRLYQIVEKVNHPEKEITASDPRLKMGKIENNTFFLPFEITNSSLASVFEIKKNIQQKLREISWENQSKLLQKFQQEETLVRGNLQGQKEDYYLINLNLEEAGKVIGFWEKKEWTSLEHQPRLGQLFCFLIKQVNEKAVGGQLPLLLTRKSDNFLLQVLKQEIPELKEGITVVRQILRSPDSVKIVVESKQKGIDPIGSCIGPAAVRIRSVSHVLFPERIDVEAWGAKRKPTSVNQKPFSEEVGNYKNIQLRTSEEGSEKRERPWTKKFNINKKF